MNEVMGICAIGLALTLVVQVHNKGTENDQLRSQIQQLEAQIVQERERLNYYQQGVLGSN